MPPLFPSRQPRTNCKYKLENSQVLDKVKNGLRELIFPMSFSNLLLPQHEDALRGIIEQTDPCDYLTLMINLGIPRDISERIANLLVT